MTVKLHDMEERKFYERLLCIQVHCKECSASEMVFDGHQSAIGTAS